jgi:hypothetical protein
VVSGGKTGEMEAEALGRIDNLWIVSLISKMMDFFEHRVKYGFTQRVEATPREGVSGHRTCPLRSLKPQTQKLWLNEAWQGYPF